MVDDNRLARLLAVVRDVADTLPQEDGRVVALRAAIEEATQGEACEVPGCGHAEAAHTRDDGYTKDGCTVEGCSCPCYVRMGEDVTDQFRPRAEPVEEARRDGDDLDAIMNDPTVTAVRHRLYDVMRGAGTGLKGDLVGEYTLAVLNAAAAVRAEVGPLEERDG